MSLGWTRQGGMDDRPEQEKMQHTDCKERQIPLFHIGREEQRRYTTATE